MVYFGDGSTSEGDLNEAMVFAASYQTPQVFFLQNNHLAISVPVTTQSRTPLYLRPRGFGIPSVQVDGNDVLASYAVTAKYLDDSRSGLGPRFIEALTYRIGAHTTSDDPTRYQDDALFAAWQGKDPISRYETFLRDRGVEQAFFDDVAAEAAAVAEDTRVRTLALENPTAPRIFQNVYSEPHPVTAAQQQWLAGYEASFGAEA
jgi:pyruvate dehydrogenase E1 component alpha subunit